MTRRRERQTDHPEADAKRDALRPLAALARDTAINKRFESVLRKQRETDRKIDDMYALLMGATPSGRPDPKGKGGAGKALHDTANQLGVLACNQEVAAEEMKRLPKIVAQEVADRIAKIFQGSLDELRAKDKELATRVDQLDGELKELHGLIVP